MGLQKRKDWVCGELRGAKENHFQLSLQKMMRFEREGKRFSSTSGRGKH